MSDAPHIVCPHCGAVNRVPATRPAAAARCGKCRSPLFEGHPVALSEAAFRFLDVVVYQFQITHRNDAVPITRDYIATGEAALRAREVALGEPG